MTLYPRKGKTFPGQTSKVLIWPERADSRAYQSGKIAEERQQTNRADQEFQHGDSSHRSAQFNTQGVYEEKSAKAKSLSLSLVFSAWYK